MGKQKRARQKFHTACVNGRLGPVNLEKSPSNESQSLEIKFPVEENPFKSIEIDLDKAKTSLDIDDDRKSVFSISKSIKRSIAQSGSNVHLKKKEKREIRKSLFLQKVNAVHQTLNDKSKGKKFKQNLAVNDLNELPQENMLFFESEFKVPKGPRPVSQKKKPIAKAKTRKEELLKNINNFKAALSQKNGKNSFDTVAEEIRKKLNNQEI